MEQNSEKEVFFDEYCPKCEFSEYAENQDPCWDCLANPVNENSHKPTEYKEKPGK